MQGLGRHDLVLPFLTNSALLWSYGAQQYQKRGTTFDANFDIEVGRNSKAIPSLSRQARSSQANFD